MGTENGGWNVIQRRTDSSTNFYRGLNEYKQGFGDKSGNFWLGLDVMNHLAKNGLTLRVDLKDVNGQTWYAKYRKFKVGDASSNYKLEVAGYTGTAGDSLSYHNNMAFSTQDADNDVWDFNCATTNKAAWWFKDCLESSLNAPYPVGAGGKYGDMTWLNDLGYGRIAFTEMKVRSKCKIYSYKKRLMPCRFKKINLMYRLLALNQFTYSGKLSNKVDKIKVKS